MIHLRDYQQTAVDSIRAAYAEGARAPLFVAPTGSGKTVTFAYIAHHGTQRGTRICIVVHRRELIRQTCRTLGAFGVPHGVIAPGHRATGHSVQVASVQTLVRRDAPPFDLMILDEAHHAAAGSWQRVAQAQPQARILGVTATPCRLDGKGLGNVFDRLILGPSIKQLTAAGHLSPARVFAPAQALDLKGIRTRGGDYAREQLEGMLNSRAITGCAVEHYRRHCDGYPAIAFCASVAHAEAVAEQFRAEGYRAASIDGSMQPDQRDGLVADLDHGRLSVLTSCDLINEGFDVPRVSAAILLRPTKSLGLHMQQIGRALRPYPGKEHAVILDHVGNVLRHGMPDADRQWSLDRGVEQEAREDAGQPAARQCPACFAVHEWAPACPYCGALYPAPAPRPAPKQQAGELVEMTQAEVSALYEQAKQAGTLSAYHVWAKAARRKPGAAFEAFLRNRKRKRVTA